VESQSVQSVTSPQPTEAPTGFDGEDNGFAAEFCARQAQLATVSSLSPAIPAGECSLDTAAEEFAGPEGESDGLGPIFNAAGCGECHIANPVLGATSQITETRAGLSQNGVFTDHPGGSLIHSRTLDTHIKFQERVNPSKANVTAIRNTISVLGDGFVEAIDSNTLVSIVNAQPSAQRGQLVSVPVLEQPGQNRTGRFGHKAQQASLLSFSADAYVNEMGITSPMQPVENTSNGDVITPDPVPGNDDEGVDVALFALFMRSTKAPPVDAAIASSADAQRGSQLFDAVGCAVCHTRTS
jgi:hypothetical protein